MSRKRKPAPGDIDPESGSRLPPVDRATLDAQGQALYDQVAGDTRSLAGLRGPAGMLLHSPRYYQAHRQLNQFVRYDSGLDARLRELAILATARELDAHFEWYQHESAARREGLEEEIIEIVRRRKAVRGVGAREAAIVNLVREALGKHRVRRSTYAAALELFSAEILVNLVGLIGEYAAVAATLTVFAQQLPDGVTSNLD